MASEGKWEYITVRGRGVTFGQLFEAAQKMSETREAYTVEYISGESIPPWRMVCIDPATGKLKQLMSDADLSFAVSIQEIAPDEIVTLPGVKLVDKLTYTGPIQIPSRKQGS